MTDFAVGSMRQVLLVLLFLLPSFVFAEDAYLASWKDRKVVATDTKCVWGKAYVLVNKDKSGKFRIKSKDGTEDWSFRIPKEWQHHKEMYVSFGPAGLNGNGTCVYFYNPDDDNDMKSLKSGKYFNDYEGDWWRRSK